MEAGGMVALIGVDFLNLLIVKGLGVASVE